MLPSIKENTLDNQHQKIKGYRELSQEEIDLMNEIKEHGETTKALLKKVADLRMAEQDAVLESNDEIQDEEKMLSAVQQSVRCLDLAYEYLQTGQMWFVRSIALPDSF